MYCNVLEFRLDKLIKIIIGRELGPLFYAQREKELMLIAHLQNENHNTNRFKLKNIVFGASESDYNYSVYPFDPSCLK